MTNVIIHYGVRGMKWGVRRHQKKAGSARKGAKFLREVEGEFNTAVKEGEKKAASATNRLKKHYYKTETARGKELAADFKDHAQKLDAKAKKHDAAAKKLEQKIKKKEAETSVSSAKPTKASKMSNDELKTKIERMSLERRYSQLVKDREATGTKTKTQRAQAEAKKILAEAGREQLKNYTGKAISGLIESVLVGGRKGYTEYTKARGG